MLTCPYCHGQNEDGALFCDQCKSDLGGVAPAAPVISTDEPPPMPEELPLPLEIPAMEMAPLEMEAVPMEIPMEIPTAQPVPLEPFEIEEAPVPLEVPPLPVEEDAPIAPAIPTAAPAAESFQIPVGANPRLYVARGQKPKVEYSIMEGLNFIGRADDKPVDIDLEEQESTERIWCSRQHAVIELENGSMTLEDLNSSNGTFLNRTRIYPGQKQPLKPNDLIQIGGIQLKVLF
ncbi:MAG: FHA domain-containing protein [Gemmataceae bacterium]|nr:FHA domain-containing protein [Gemmataceae bacterium]